MACSVRRLLAPTPAGAPDDGAAGRGPRGQRDHHAAAASQEGEGDEEADGGEDFKDHPGLSFQLELPPVPHVPHQLRGLFVLRTPSEPRGRPQLGAPLRHRPPRTLRQALPGGGSGFYEPSMGRLYRPGRRARIAVCSNEGSCRVLEVRGAPLRLGLGRLYLDPAREHLPAAGSHQLSTGICYLLLDIHICGSQVHARGHGGHLGF
mmetsp:Transcript_124411/g.295262  ORF Transcript_124411/g.295262 Transcript_124411/m.295262 type:complete len:206 (-) Transcript_124411:482-1099(-)